MKENENNPYNSGSGQFGLPGGYFQRSSAAIRNTIEWQDEHREFPALLAAKTESGFAVPPRYFEETLLRLELMDAGFFSDLKKTNPFLVPDNYFEKSKDILSEQVIPAQELKRLNAISRENNFKVPDHYFQQGERRMASLLANERKARRIVLVPRQVWYSAAALLLLALGIWTFRQSPTQEEAEDCGTIACLERHDLLKTKTLESLDNDELYELVNSKELESRLNSATPKRTDTTAKDQASDNDAIDALQDDI